MANSWTLKPGKHPSYKSRRMLEDVIERKGFSDIRHMIVQTVDGRWTAVFMGEGANRVIFFGFAWWV
jgi:predicted Ser/Thr protein kinase